MKTAIFKSSSKDHEQFNGQVNIIRKLTIEESEEAEMYECEQNGSTFHAFSDEIIKQ